MKKIRMSKSSISEKEKEAVLNVLDKEFLGMGDEVKLFEEKIRTYLKDKELIGLDLLKRITIYTLLMHKGFSEGHFFDHLMQTHWFKETIELYFNGNYRDMYDEVLGGFLDRGIVKIENDLLVTTVKP